MSPQSTALHSKRPMPTTARPTGTPSPSRPGATQCQRRGPRRRLYSHRHLPALCLLCPVLLLLLVFVPGVCGSHQGGHRRPCIAPKGTPSWSIRTEAQYCPNTTASAALSSTEAPRFPARRTAARPDTSSSAMTCLDWAVPARSTARKQCSAGPIAARGNGRPTARRGTPPESRAGNSP